MSELTHSAKGTKWKSHKYIEIKNGRYVYAKNNHGGSSGKTPGFDSKKYKEKRAKQNPNYGAYRGAVNAESEEGNRKIQVQKNAKRRKAEKEARQKAYNAWKSDKSTQGKISAINEAGKKKTKYTQDLYKKKKDRATKTALAEQSKGRNRTEAINKAKFKAKKKHEAVSSRNAGKSRSAVNSNSEKLLAAQRKKQRNVFTNTSAKAKKLARALRRKVKYGPKEISRNAQKWWADVKAKYGNKKMKKKAKKAKMI